MRHAPALAFAILWCAVTLFPVSNLVVVTGVTIAERTLFLPSVGAALTLGGAVSWSATMAAGWTTTRRCALAFAGVVVLTIAAGVFKMSFLPFVLASIVARAMRFYLVAGLLYWFGEPIREFIDKRLSLVTTAFVILLVGGFVAIRFLF